MMNAQMTGGLVQTWVSVVDARGRAHLEAHWVMPTPESPAQAPTTATTPAHSHAA